VAAERPEDAALRRWKTIIADDLRAPAGTPPAALVPELVAYLGSPDPVRRDGTTAHGVHRAAAGRQRLRIRSLLVPAQNLSQNRIAAQIAWECDRPATNIARFRAGPAEGTGDHGESSGWRTSCNVVHRPCEPAEVSGCQRRPFAATEERIVMSRLRTYISDLHLPSKDAVDPPPGQLPYGWLSPDQAKRLAKFLASDIVTSSDQLFLVGDVLDLQICPHDVKPPTAIDVFTAHHNQPIVKAIRDYADGPGHTVFWILGNHELGATASDAHYLHPQINFLPRYDEYPLRVRHGHEGCLFNGPDPRGRDVPLGYFISRFVATAAARGLHPVGLSLQLLWNSGPELVALLKAAPLAECVFDAVCHAADITLDDDVIMPDGSARKVGEVRATYQDLVHEWGEAHGGYVMNAVLAEWDPFYDLPVSKRYLNIIGHSHEHKYSSLVTGGVYLNLGSWCGNEAHFAKSWLENAGESNEVVRAQLFRWDPVAGPQSASTRAILPTK